MIDWLLYLKVEQENKLKLILKENEDLQKDIADVSFFNMEKICFEIRDFERLVRMEMFNIYLSPKKKWPNNWNFKRVCENNSRIFNFSIVV